MSKLVIACGVVGAMAVASLAVAAPTINVGTKFLIPNTANQVISLGVTDPASTQVQAVNLFAQIGDGLAAGPSFTSASVIAAGSLFAADNTGNNALSLSANGKQVSVSTTTAGSAPDPVTGIITPSFVTLTPGGNTFATVTVNTTGFSTAGSSFALSLSSPGPTQFVTTDAIATTANAGTLKITQTGDATLDGTTNFSDLSTLLVNYNQPGGWTKGDFTGDNTVNFSDLSALLLKYNQSVPLGLTAPSASLGASAVPEPTTWALLAISGVCGLLMRRRMRRA